MVTGTLRLKWSNTSTVGCSHLLSDQVPIELAMLEGGVLRMKALTDRFGISDVLGDGEISLSEFSVLEHTDRKLVIASTEVEDLSYMLQFSPFRIVQKYQGKTRMVVNHRDSLYFENTGQEITSSSCAYAGKRDYLHPDAKESYGIGFYLASRHIFGLAERPDRFRLRTTIDGEPYRLQSLDVFPHETPSRDPLYSSIPYTMGQTREGSMSIAWMTASESWVDIYDEQYS